MAVLNLIIIVVTNIIELKFVKELNGGEKKKIEMLFSLKQIDFLCIVRHILLLKEKVKGI